MRQKRRSTTRSSPPTWRTAASMWTTAPAPRCGPISGANTRCTPRSCAASASSGNSELFVLAGHEGRDHLVHRFRRLDVRRVADALERPVFAAWERARDGLAARLRRDRVLGSAGDQHALRIAPGIGGEPSLREAMHCLPVALRSHAPLAPAHELERDRWRTLRDKRGRALRGQAFRPELVELPQPLGELRFPLGLGQLAIAAGGAEG